MPEPTRRFLLHAQKVHIARERLVRGLARPRRSGEHRAIVPTSHIGAISTSLGDDDTRGPVAARLAARGAQRSARPHGPSWRRSAQQPPLLAWSITPRRPIASRRSVIEDR